MSTNIFKPQLANVKERRYRSIRIPRAVFELVGRRLTT
jgi:hypothetical protein